MQTIVWKAFINQRSNSRMPDEVYQFCGNCYWYDVDDDHRASGWCAERKCKTSCFDVCKKHKFG